MNQVTKINFEGLPIYIGLDVHKNSWKASFATDNVIKKTIHIGVPFVDNLVAYLHKAFPKGEYLCAYEAGFSGFWAQEQLELRGVKTIVVNPADIPTSDKDRQFKNDKRDSKKICSALRSGELEGIYVPSKQSQIDRTTVRARYQIANSHSRVKCRIKSLLNFYGIEAPSDLETRYWSRRYIVWLEQISKDRKMQGLELLIAFLLDIRQRELQATRMLRALSKESRHEKLARLLKSVPGIGLLTTMLLITEIDQMSRFKNNNKLQSFVGLIPTSKSSGDKERIGEMTKRGNKKIRKALIESAWVAITKDPELLMKYENYRKEKKANIAIVKIAVILARRIRYVWNNEQPYIIAQN